MGTTSVAQVSSTKHPVLDPPLHIASNPPKQADESMFGAAAGWYYDPEDHAVYRYWDGEAWTEHCSERFLVGRPEEATG
ncbi:MAG: DUF2510 domain-containing protein [Acidimicrobiia bacterium]|nr:DUF2510 domain-containing protein [Acidimicrobiia bacterium]